MSAVGRFPATLFGPTETFRCLKCPSTSPTL